MKDIAYYFHPLPVHPHSPRQGGSGRPGEDSNGRHPQTYGVMEGPGGIQSRLPGNVLLKSPLGNPRW